MPRRLSPDAHPAIGQWLDAIDEQPTPFTETGESIQCDFCEQDIPPNTLTTSYVTTNLVNEDFAGATDRDNPYYFLRIYCPNCDRRELLDPCRGYFELLLEAFIDGDYRIRDPQIIDFSVTSEGVPYNPQELWEIGHSDVTWTQFQQTMQLMKGHTVKIGPQDIADTYHYEGINPKDIYNDTGEITLTNEEVQEIQEKIQD